MMIIDYFINTQQRKVEALTNQMAISNELKRQHHQALNYRLKRFAVTKVGIASAFSAGVGYQTLQSCGIKQSKLKQLSKFKWLLKLF